MERGGIGLQRHLQLISRDDPSILVHANQWNTTGHVKPGYTVRHCPNCDSEVHVLAVDPAGICITATAAAEDGFHTARIEDLGRRTRPSRLGIQANARHVFRFIYSLDNHPFIALRWLVALFHGEMGPQYANLAAEAWIVRAGYAINQPPTAPELVAWAQLVLDRAERDGVDRSSLPPELEALAGVPDPEVGVVAFNPGWTQDQAIDEFMRSVEQSDHHANAILTGPDLGPPPQEAQDLPRGIVALCSREETLVVILGPSLSERDSGYFDVLDIETYETYAVHGSELESEDYELDEQELLEIIDEAGAWGVPTYIFLAEYPWKTVSVSPALGCLIYLTLFRMAAEKSIQALVRSAYRQARERYAGLSKEDRKQVIAIAPEINAPKGGIPAAKGGVQPLVTAVSRIVDDLLRQAGIHFAGDDGQVVPEPPEAIPEPTADAATATIASPVERVDKAAADMPALTVAAPSPDTAPAAISDPPPAQPARATADRGLRFQVHDHRLLAMEWDLAESNDAYVRAVASTLGWLGDRLGVPLPKSWDEGAHELELGGVRIQLEAGSGIFALRMEHPDYQEAARTWRLEAMVIAGPKGKRGMSGIRVSTQDRIVMSPPHTGLPGLVAAWQQSPGLLLGGSPTGMSLQVRNAREFAAWQATLSRPRQYLMTVTTESTGFVPFQSMSAVIQRVTMLREAVTCYEDVYGRPWPGNVHVFTPGEPGPRNWHIAERKGLVALQNAAIELRQRPDTPTFKQLRDMMRDATAAHMAAKLVPEAAPPESCEANQRLPEPAVEAEAPRDGGGYRVDELQQMLDIALADHAATKGELDERKADLAQMRAKLQALEAQLSIRQDTVPEVDEIPDALDKLPDWIPSLHPRVVIVEKAVRVAARTEHREVEKIYRGLRALATDYWASRFEGDEQAYARWTEFLKESRMRWSPVGVANDIGRYQGEYQAVWEGRTYTMTHHLQGSNSRDPTRCIRIYAAIDEERRLIVIGALPAHLTNTMT